MRKIGLILALIAGLWLAWPVPPALADDPPECTDRTDTFNFDADTEGWNFEVISVSGTATGTGIWEAGKLKTTLSLGSHSLIWSKWEKSFNSGYTQALFCFDVASNLAVAVRGNAVYDGSAVEHLSVTHNGATVRRCFNLQESETVEKIQIVLGNSSGFTGFTNQIYLDNFTFYACDTEAHTPTPSCSTVSDADFENDETWTLAGPGDPASIADGSLTLPPWASASQNIILSASTDYEVSISTTVTSPPADLVLRLGLDTGMINITSTGWYTTTLTTPANLSGAIKFTLLNTDAVNQININFVCLYLSDSETVCLGPPNGTFENDSGWIWYRGATWRQPANLAYLPYASKGLISSSASYEFPELEEGQYLLMGFDALGEGSDSGVISIRAQSGFNDIVYNYQTFPRFYRYEMDLTSLAGLETDLAFANPGADGIEGIVSSANVELDNICVFLTDRSIQLPYPIDPNAINPVELGFGYTSCDDIDGILAGFGINIQQYRAEYYAGASLWDPSGWVPWLVAAFWNILATYLCIFMATFVTLVDILEYIINNFLNIANWILQGLPGFWDWLNLWFQWIGQTLANLSSSYGNFLGLWADWIGKKLVLTSSTIGVTMAALSEWIGQSLANLSNRFGDFLASWSQWIGQSLANLSNWIGQTLANLWNWLASYFTSLNGLRALLNWLIDAWNAFLAWLGQTISAILDDGAWLWNDILRPFLADVWGYILKSPVSLVGLLIDFLAAVWELLKMMFLWVWHNIISIAHTPLTFYKAFNSGINGSAYNLVSCIGSNFWCTFLAGVQLINQLVAHSILYPVFIAGMILSTLVIVWDNFKELFSIDIK